MSSDCAVLFTPFDLRGLPLANRVVMSPMSRHRAVSGVNVPHPLGAKYYEQRASAGLIVAEGTQISPRARGFAGVPGIYTQDQVSTWRLTTDAVHAAGGKIFLQLWHAGRVSHHRQQPDGLPPPAPSAIRALAKAVLEDGSLVDADTPREMTVAEVEEAIVEYRTAARNAIAAGFDGVEVHGGNGYLVHQFLSAGSNRRTDRFGGSLSQRITFAVEVVDSIGQEIGARRVGIRLSPINPYNDMYEPEPQRLYVELLRQLNRQQIGYVHMVEGDPGQPRSAMGGFDFAAARRLFAGPWIVNNQYDAEMAANAVSSGYADLVCFGRPFIANPDLVDRLRRGGPLNVLNPATLYGGGEAGYTDYPPLAVSR